MKKNMQITLIIILLVAIVLVILSFLVFSKKCVTYYDGAGNKSGGCFYIWQKGWWSGLSLFNSKKEEAGKTKTFSEIEGFSFDYPVFEWWELGEPQITKNNNTGDVTAIIFLKYLGNIDFGVAPQIKIVKKIQLAQIDLTKLSTNPNGVKYIYNKEEGKIFFYAPGFTVDIYPFIYESNGYSGKAFVDKVLETFKFSSSLENDIQPDPITIMEPILLTYLSGFSEKYQNAINAVIEKLKDDGENPDDFYAKFEEFEKSGLNGSLITFHLSHKDDFTPENRNKRGNPSGKSRDMVYDTNQEKIIKEALWQ